MFKRNQLPYNKTFSFHNHKINYHVIGKGKSVVFIHGAFTNTTPYAESLELLGKHYKIYVIDLPGFGGSDVIKGRRHDSKLFVDAVSAFLKEEHLEKAPIVALSMGVILTIKLANQGETQGDLILIAAPGQTDRGFKTRLFTKLPHKVRRLLVSTDFGRKHLFLPAASANTGAGAHTTDMRLKYLSYTSSQALVDSDYDKDIKKYEEYLPEIKNKMVFIYGEHDRMKKYKIEYIKEFIEIPDSGHNVFVHAPEEMVKVLRSLLG